MPRASRCSRAVAGAMCTVWKAPATLSGMIRVRAGASACRAASSSTVPAATIWPAPLWLAAVSPAASIAARTSSSLPPMTAVIEVGRTAEASAMPLPRSRTKTRACSADSTPTRAAAVISPTECPATTPTSRKASAESKRAAAVARPAATSSGWATAVSRMVSSSAPVP
ncbi:hypothetical protein SDC9_155025 [bioreactor metagenome]|uniref:Uncharacterized protein n=1 Tax=bioreactor metagenome TaxID=1076179 RepID=A0A645F5C4_9ZZZZ